MLTAFSVLSPFCSSPFGQFCSSVLTWVTSDGFLLLGHRGSNFLFLFFLFWVFSLCLLNFCVLLLVNLYFHSHVFLVACRLLSCFWAGVCFHGLRVTQHARDAGIYAVTHISYANVHIYKCMRSLCTDTSDFKLENNFLHISDEIGGIRSKPRASQRTDDMRNLLASPHRRLSC